MAQSIKIKRKGLAALLTPKATIIQKQTPKVKANVRKGKA